MKLLTIHKEGGSRVLVVTNSIPKDWRAVTIEVKKTTSDSVTLKINKVN